MPNSTVPAADEGLPKLNPGAPDADQGSILVESDLGLAISRGRMVHSLSPTILAPERADRFYATFDRLMSLEQEGHHQHEQAWRVSRKTGRWPEGAHAVASDLRARAKETRRQLICDLKRLRAAPSKTLDDILFKAMVSEVCEHYDIHFKRTLGHSIVLDLLGAQCQWRA